MICLLYTSLGIPELSDEEKELALKMKGILDRIDDETRIDRTTAFRAVLDKMTKEPEENWSLHYIDRKSTRLNSSHSDRSRMPSSA